MNHKPTPPAARLFCEQCGDITASGHTNWLCRLFSWLDRKPAPKRTALGSPDGCMVIGETDRLVLVYKRQLSAEQFELIRDICRVQGLRTVIVSGVDEVYIQRNMNVREA
jgi:hypothetical protein